jgi:AAA domain
MQAENFGFDRTTEPPRSKPKPRFTLIPFNQIRARKTSRYLIKGLISDTGLVVVWGPPKCGKSFWVFDAVMHIALGWQYRGRRVIQGNVVYLALEGQTGFDDRVEAFRQKRFEDGVGDVPNFYLVKERTDLIKDKVELIKCIQTQCTVGKPAVVVIDTMNRSLVGSESNDEDMAAYIKAADAIHEAFNCVVIIIHHCGINESRPRGHTSLTGAADIQISVKSLKKDATKYIIATVECAKDLPEGAVIGSQLEVVEIGVDQDEDPITSCHVVPSAVAEVSVSETKETDTIRIFRAAFTEAVDSFGEMVRVRGDGPQVRAVEVSKVREEFERRYLTGEGDPKKRKEAARKAFGRAIKKLPPKFANATWNDQEWIWRVD